MLQYSQNSFERYIFTCTYLQKVTVESVGRRNVKLSKSGFLFNINSSWYCFTYFLSNVISCLKQYQKVLLFKCTCINGNWFYFLKFATQLCTCLNQQRFLINILKHSTLNCPVEKTGKCKITFKTYWYITYNLWNDQ